MSWVIFDSYLVTAKKKKDLPDVHYKYVAITSDIGYHFDFTKDRKKAYVFDDEAYSMSEVSEIADLLSMKLRELN